MGILRRFMRPASLAWIGVGDPTRYAYYDVTYHGPGSSFGLCGTFISWTKGGALDGFLCIDRNGNGKIDDGRELFGTATFLSDGTVAAHGFIALAEFDTYNFGGNGDGWIDHSDLWFDSLLLWTDLNHDAESDANEIVTLDGVGVVAIKVNSKRRASLGWSQWA